MKVLPQNRYDLLKDRISSIPFNTFFARSIIEHHVTGSILVDNINDPKSAYIFHPYGLSLLIGDHTNDDFNRHLTKHLLDVERKRIRHEWLQAYPFTWNDELKEILGPRLIQPNDPYDPNKVEIHSRVNFEFDRSSFMDYVENNEKDLPEGYEIEEIDEIAFNSIEGLVVPKAFWDNYDDFRKRGIGFCIKKDNEIASWAYTVWIHGNMNEIGIETLPKYRKQGLAEIVSIEFIKYCLKNNQTPIWSCRLENTGSYWLALKLGFRETWRIPFYRLCENGARHH